METVVSSSIKCARVWIQLLKNSTEPESTFLIQNKDLSLFNAFTFTPNTGCYKIVFIKRVKKALKIAGVLQVVCSTKMPH